MSDYSHRAETTKRLEAQPPGWPCLCIHGCPCRHWNISTDLCSECVEQVRAGNQRHGEMMEG